MLDLVLAAALTVGAALAADPAGRHVDAQRALAAVAAGEPSIAAVQEAAAREADLSARGADAFARRARLAALLPRITIEYRRDEQSARVVGLQGAGEVDYLRLAPGNTVGVRATWDLGALVAPAGELAAARDAVARARRIEAAVRRATALYYERRAALVGLILEPPEGARARAEVELEIDRLGAELDALTGGLHGRGGER
jgi:hypothetical protein